MAPAPFYEDDDTIAASEAFPTRAHKAATQLSDEFILTFLILPAREDTAPDPTDDLEGAARGVDVYVLDEDGDRIFTSTFGDREVALLGHQPPGTSREGAQLGNL